MSPTGEQPIAKAEPALSVSFDRAVVLLGLFASLAGVYAGYRVTQKDVETNTGRIVALEAGQSAQKEAHSALKERVTVGETNYKNVDQKLGEMNSKLDRILELRGTSNAVYRPRPNP